MWFIEWLNNGLPLFVPGGLRESLTPAVWVGAMMVCLLNLRFGWPLSGLAVPGFLVAVLLNRPWALVTIVSEGVIAYLVFFLFAKVYLKKRGVPELFGRDRFFGIFIISILVRVLGDEYLIPSLASYFRFPLEDQLYSVGALIVGLIANYFWKPGLIRGTFQLGLTTLLSYLVVTYGLFELTNYSLSEVRLLFDSQSYQVSQSGWSYLLMTVTALIASRMNLTFGWEYSGIILPALVSLELAEPIKLVGCVVDTALTAVLGALVLSRPAFRDVNCEGARKIMLFFSISLFTKILFQRLLIGTSWAFLAGEIEGFGFLVSSLFAIKIYEKGIGLRLSSATIQTAAIGFTAAYLLGALIVGRDESRVGRQIKLPRGLLPQAIFWDLKQTTDLEWSKLKIAVESEEAGFPIRYLPNEWVLAGSPGDSRNLVQVCTSGDSSWLVVQGLRLQQELSAVLLVDRSKGCRSWTKGISPSQGLGFRQVVILSASKDNLPSRLVVGDMKISGRAESALRRVLGDLHVEWSGGEAQKRGVRELRASVNFATLPVSSRADKLIELEFAQFSYDVLSQVVSSSALRLPPEPWARPVVDGFHRFVLTPLLSGVREVETLVGVANSFGYQLGFVSGLEYSVVLQSKAGLAGGFLLLSESDRGSPDFLAVSHSEHSGVIRQALGLYHSRAAAGLYIAPSTGRELQRGMSGNRLARAFEQAVVFSALKKSSRKPQPVTYIDLRAAPDGYFGKSLQLVGDTGVVLGDLIRESQEHPQLVSGSVEVKARLAMPPVRERPKVGLTYRLSPELIKPPAAWLGGGNRGTLKRTAVLIPRHLRRPRISFSQAVSLLQALRVPVVMTSFRDGSLNSIPLSSYSCNKEVKSIYSKFEESGDPEVFLSLSSSRLRAWVDNEIETVLLEVTDGESRSTLVNLTAWRELPLSETASRSSCFFTVGNDTGSWLAEFVLSNAAFLIGGGRCCIE